MTTRRAWLTLSLLSLVGARARGVERALAQAGGSSEGEIPASNRASLTTPPPRPGLSDTPERMRSLLFEACLRDEPERARELFLPRAAFRLIKATSEPDRLYDRLYRAYERDIHGLNARLREESGGELTAAAFAGFRFTGRRGFVRVGEEANRLPYWAQRHSFLAYTIGGRPRELEVRTMIAWGERWFITHLGEFH